MPPNSNKKYGFSKEVANSILRYSIRLLRRQYVPAPARINEALDFKSILEENGYPWQAKILSSWVNRCRAGEWPFIPSGECVELDDLEDPEALKDGDDLGEDDDVGRWV